MTNFANFDLDRRPITKQFGPLTGYRKEEEGYMDVKMMFLGVLGQGGGLVGGI